MRLPGRCPMRASRPATASWLGVFSGVPLPRKERRPADAARRVSHESQESAPSLNPVLGPRRTRDGATRQGAARSWGDGLPAAAFPAPLPPPPARAGSAAPHPARASGHLPRSRRDAATAAACRASCAASSCATSPAACWPSASPACTAAAAAATTSFPSRARAAASAPPAGPDAWPTPPRTWSTTSCRACPCASGCSPSPTACATCWPTTRVPQTFLRHRRAHLPLVRRTAQADRTALRRPRRAPDADPPRTTHRAAAARSSSRSARARLRLVGAPTSRSTRSGASRVPRSGPPPPPPARPQPSSTPRSPTHQLPTGPPSRPPPAPRLGTRPPTTSSTPTTRC